VLHAHRPHSFLAALVSASKVRPGHYSPGSKYEVISVIEFMGLSFSAGNALKYLARAGKKPGEDLGAELRKAEWYLMREIEHGDVAALDYTKIHPDQWSPILAAWGIAEQTERADALTAIFCLQFPLALAAVRREIAGLPPDLAGRVNVDGVEALLSLRPGDISAALGCHAAVLLTHIDKHLRLAHEFRRRPGYQNNVARWARIAGRQLSIRRRFLEASALADRGEP
jgi:hypothetical protein